MRFLSDVMTELRKVRWISKTETIKSTLAVITTTVIVVMFFVTIDLGISNLKDLFNW
jgi:preprotein translocase subunit SecE